jgi:hypothetical protein
MLPAFDRYETATAGLYLGDIGGDLGVVAAAQVSRRTIDPWTCSPELMQ